MSTKKIVWGAESESSGTGSITGVNGPGPANGGQSDAVSGDGGNSAATTYGPGSSVAGSSSSSTPSEADKRRKKAFIFWGKK